jgi:hypothetical protein
MTNKDRATQWRARCVPNITHARYRRAAVSRGETARASDSPAARKEGHQSDEIAILMTIGKFC